MRTRSLLSAAVCAAVLAGAGAGAALAGEITGNGKATQGPAHANSICVFSGLNDDPEEAGTEGGRTQSYGQGVRKGLKGTEDLPSPGIACNGHSGFFAGGGEE